MTLSGAAELAQTLARRAAEHVAALAAGVLLLGAWGALYAEGLPRAVAWAAALSSGWFLYRTAQESPRGALLRERLERPRRLLGFSTTGGALLADGLAIATVFLVSVWLLGPAWTGARVPMEHDHAPHAYKAWLLVTQLLPQGRVRGWTHWILSGDPYGELYPLLGDLYVAGVYYLGRALTFGRLSFFTAYGLAVALLWPVLGTSLYLGAKRFLGRPAALLGSLFVLTDQGNWDSGIWEWAINWGVWPQFLAYSFAILALSRFQGLLESPAPWRVAVVSVLLALATLTHPIASLLFLPAFLFCALLHGLGPKGSLGRSLLWLGAVLALSWGLMATWQLPFSRYAPTYAASLGQATHRINDLATRMARGNAFERTHTIPTVLGLLGIVVALRRRATGPLLFAAHALWTFYFCTVDAQLDLRLLDASEVFRRILYGRVFGLAKLSWMLCAGYAVGAYRQRREEPKTRSAPLRREVALVFLLGLLVAPYLRGVAGEGLAQGYRLQYTGMESYQDALHWREFLEWSRRELYERDFQRNGFFRVFYLSNVDHHQHFFYSAPIFNHLPIHKSGNTPATSFYNRVCEPREDIARAMNVKYVVSTYDDPFPNLEFLRRFGVYRVYRVRDFRSQLVTVPGAEVRVLRWADEEVRFTVRGAAPGARARVAVAYYPRWHAWVDGREVPVGQVPVVPDRPATYLEVPVTNGEVVLRYTRERIHLVADLLSLFSLVVVFGLGLLSARPALRARAVERLAWWLEHLLPWLERLAVGGLVVVPAVAWWSVSPPWGRGVLQDFRRTAAAGLSYELHGVRHECRRLDLGILRSPPHYSLPLDPERWDCAPISSLKTAGRETACAIQVNEENTNEFLGMYRQTVADAAFYLVPRDGAVEVRYSDVPMGGSLQGMLYLSSRVSLTEQAAQRQGLEVLVEGRTVGFVAASSHPVPFRFPTPQWAGRRASVMLRYRATGSEVDLCLAAATHR